MCESLECSCNTSQCEGMIQRVLALASVPLQSLLIHYMNKEREHKRGEEEKRRKSKKKVKESTCIHRISSTYKCMYSYSRTCRF